MQKILKFEKPLFVLFAVLSVVYFAVSAVVFLSRPAGGDEFVFIPDLEFVLQKGLVAGIEKQISVPYTMLAYPFALFMDGLYALRLVNVLLLVSLFLYFYKVAKIANKSFYCYLMFYIATINFFFAGLNDPLFIVGLTIFFSEVFFYFERGKMNSETLAFSGLVVAFFTREIVLIYAPVIVFALFLLFWNGFRLSKKIVLPMVLLLFFLLLNIPSLATNHKLSYDDKKPPEGANWVQRQYLAQLWVNEGKIPNYSHPSWEQTIAYLHENGPDSLPDGILNGMTHDIKLTVVEFFKDFYYCLFFGFRQLGLILFFPFLFLIDGIFIRRAWSVSQFLPVVVITITAIFSLIIISFVELRWFGSVFIPAIVFFTFYSGKSKYGALLISGNYIVLSLLSLYGIYGVASRF